MQVPKMPVGGEKVHITGDPPASVDWSTQNPGCVNIIRNQEQCGSCWAFAATAVFGNNRCIQGRDPQYVQYSEQYVVSCDTQDFGCNGGYLDLVWVFLCGTGTALDSCVPYTSGSGVAPACPTTCTGGGAITLTKAVSYANVCTGIPSMENAIAAGPITTGFYVYYDFEVYTSGIYQHTWGQYMGGHSVEFVGYGT